MRDQQLREIAMELTNRNIPTPRGRDLWNAMTVMRVMERLGIAGKRKANAQLTAAIGTLPPTHRGGKNFGKAIWFFAHSEFSDAVSRARAARVLWLERKLLRSRKGAETTAAIFALKNADPTEWRDLKHTEHRHVVSADMLTDEQLNAIASGASPADVGVIEGDFERLED